MPKLSPRVSEFVARKIRIVKEEQPELSRKQVLGKAFGVARGKFGESSVPGPKKKLSKSERAKVARKRRQ